MKFFGTRKNAEHIAARKAKTPRRGRRGCTALIVALGIVLVLGGVGVAIYQANVKPPEKKQPPETDVQPAQQEQTENVYIPAEPEPDAPDAAQEDETLDTETPRSYREGVYNILVCGTDGDGYRTDTIMVAHLDTTTQEVALMSIPRDTVVLSQSGNLMKINAVYAGGGAEGMERLARRLSSLLGFEMDGYVLVNLDAFVTIVDLVGGVTVNVPQDMYYSDASQGLFIDLRAGEQTLNGEQAMGLVRYRKGYASQDIQRTKVQQGFLKALAKQCLSIENLTISKLKEYVNIFNENVTTDLTVGNMLYFAQQLMACDFDAMKTWTVEGEGATINGVSYYPLYASSIVKIVNEAFNPYDTELTLADVDVVTPDVAQTYQKVTGAQTPEEPDAPEEADPQPSGQDIPLEGEDQPGPELPDVPGDGGTPDGWIQTEPDDTAETDFWE